MLPALALLVTFMVYPALQMVRYGFTNATLVDPSAATFVGWRNFTRLANDGEFRDSIVHTFYFALLIVPIQSFLALLLAVLINQPLRGRAFFRTAFFSPVVTSMVVVSVLWSFFYSGDGLFNAVLQDLHLPSQPFLQDTSQAMPALVVMSIWQGVGYQMVLFLAGLQGIPEQLYEASTIDGASKFAQFWLITIPQLRNTIIFVVVITTTFAFKLFTQVYVMTGGGPFGVTRTIIFELVQNGIQYSRLGYGSAMAVVFFLLVLLIQVIQRALIREDRA